MIGYIIGLIIVGLLVGALGRLLHPGSDPMGILMTIVIGVAATLIVGLLLHGVSAVLGFIIAVVVAIVLVALWSRMAGGRGGALARRGV